jgi:glycosyltransferase involved in cell wall biosynthesis
VIYAHWLWPGGAAALHLRSRFEWPVVAIARGSEMHHWQSVNRHCRPYVERVLHESNQVLANCAGLREEGYRLAPSLTRRIGVLYNGCDTHRFAPVTDREAVRRTLGFDLQAKLMLFCGSVIERKGIRNLVRAWERFGAQSSNWQLVVVGRLVDSELVRLLARADRVTLAGPVPHHEVISYMRAADAYVQPSVHEGLANATMEAMAAGLPVIATDTGGQCELITDGHSGLLIPIEDSAALSAAFVRIANDRDEAQRMGSRARETIISRFSYPAQVAALAALLADTASEHQTRTLSDVAIQAREAARMSAASL